MFAQQLILQLENGTYIHITAQLAKASDEIKAEIAALEAREPSVDLSGLKAAAQALDDIVPDPAPPAE